MAMEKVSLTIEGESGAEVRVIPRTPSDPPPDPVYSGYLDQEGRVKVSIPRGYYVVLSPGFTTGQFFTSK
jgi:hypothetical protein